MIINEHEFPVETIWEGELIEPVTMRGSILPTVSIGKPVWWNDRDVLGSDWVSPTGAQGYRLARFVFSLRPSTRQEIKRIEFLVHFSAEGDGLAPVVYDVYPKTLTEDQIGEVNIGIGPEIKFSEVKASIAKAETKITFKQSVLIIAANGVGESVARWTFRSHPSHPLVGSQTVFTIVELPSDCLTAYANLELTAEVTDRRWGVLRGLLSAKQREDLQFVFE